MAKDTQRSDVGPLWAARLAVVLIVLVVGVATVLLYFAARGPR